MDLAFKKLDLIHRLMLIRDEASLERVSKVIDMEMPLAEEGIPEEDIAELERRRDLYLKGESVPHSKEESMRIVRERVKR